MNDVISKLIKLARGNINLVQEAIVKSAAGQKKALLSDVVEYILRYRE